MLIQDAPRKPVWRVKIKNSFLDVIEEEVEGPLPAELKFKGTLLGTPNREPQEYSRNIIEYKDPGMYIPTIFLGFPVVGFPVKSLYSLGLRT